VSLKAIEKALQAKKYKVITVTHVDTSTGMPYLRIQFCSYALQPSCRTSNLLQQLSNGSLLIPWYDF
jgi:hypothetical protein